MARPPAINFNFLSSPPDAELAVRGPHPGHLPWPLLPFWLLRLMQHQLDHCPTRHRKRAALILVAVDIEPGLVLSSNPVFADVLLALDLQTAPSGRSGGQATASRPPQMFAPDAVMHGV